MIYTMISYTKAYHVVLNDIKIDYQNNSGITEFKTVTFFLSEY